VGWRDLARWLVLLVALSAVGAGLTAGFSWWGYRTLNVVLPGLLGERLEKIGLALEVASRAREMALAEQEWFVSGNEEYRARWQEAAAALDRAVVALRGTVRTAQGQELLRNIADARVRWWFGARDDAAREQLLAAADEFAAFQRRRLGDDLAETLARLAGIAARFSLGVTVTGLLALGAVAAGAAVVSRALLVSELVLLTTLNAVVVADRRGRVVAVNRAFEEMTGLRRRDVAGRPLAAVGPTGRLLEEVLRTGEGRRDQKVTLRLPGGKERCLTVDLLPWRDDRGRVLGGMAVVRDVTAQWERERELAAQVDQLRELADRDGLTGLYNHRTFMELLAQAVEEARAARRSLALLMIDLDHFKVYNDTLGHPQGDRLLEEFGRVLVGCVRETDLVARYGGDEFTVLLAGADSTAAVEVAERIRRVVADYPFPGREILPGGRLTVSVGLAFYPSSARTCADLVRRADAALYEAKRTARNRVEVYYSALEELREALAGERGALITTVKSLLAVINARDRYTFHHSEQVVRYSTWLARGLGLDGERLRELRVAALVHDLGKIHVDPAVLNKPGPLTAAEWEQMRQHPVHGANILRPVRSLGPVIPAVLHHHERWDGKGYPDGLAGEQIPLPARIIAVADAFDAMTTDRPYRPALTEEAAARELERGAGSQFDPSLVRVFLEVLAERGRTEQR
jgi:diguanylate cyclase (GGDEF)-like protein/PAS domain S-box-containing protein